jgi:pyridoxal phosphate enzyme (YggS family)
MNSLETRLADVSERVRQAALAAGRAESDVRIVAVSKTVPAAVVAEAISAGVGDIGENYIQEARQKKAALPPHGVQWHFIGHLQTNKAKYAVKMFDLIHTVDSVRLAAELDRMAGAIGKIQPVLIQVNIAGEASKSGAAPQEVPALVRRIAALQHLRLEGLMTIPPYFNDPERVRPLFGKLRRLRDRVREESVAGVSMAELSMGMTGDFEVAIAEGATLVRIGTAIFGARS